MLPLALALAPSLIQGVQSIRQKNMANNLEKSNYIPPSQKRAVSSAQTRASKSTAPGYERAVNQMRQTTANTIEQAKKAGSSSGQIQEAVAAADRTQKQEISNLSAQNEQYIDRARMDLERNLVQQGQYEQANENQFQAAKSALRGASQQNAFNAVTNAAEVGVTAAGSDFSKTGSSTDNQFLGLDQEGIKKALASRQGGEGTLTPSEISYLKSIGMLSPNKSLELSTGLI